jgi:hypothetical protein
VPYGCQAALNPSGLSGLTGGRGALGVPKRCLRGALEVLQRCLRGALEGPVVRARARARSYEILRDHMRSYEIQ